MADGQSATLEQELGDLLDQERFDPPEDVASAALISDLSEHEKAAKDFQGWWGEQARALHWFTDFEEVLDDSDPPFFRGFKDGALNASYICVDRHVGNGLEDLLPVPPHLRSPGEAPGGMDGRLVAVVRREAPHQRLEVVRVRRIDQAGDDALGRRVQIHERHPFRTVHQYLI